MTLRLAGLAALAVLSSACTFTSPSTVKQPVDYSDAQTYDQPWGTSPNYRGVTADTAPAASAVAEAPPVEKAPPAAEDPSVAKASSEAESASASAPASAPSGNLLGSPAWASRQACYDAALQTGMKKGSCTLLSDRKYVLVGDK